jgi:hypothetical protein
MLHPVPRRSRAPAARILPPIFCSTQAGRWLGEPGDPDKGGDRLAIQATHPVHRGAAPRQRRRQAGWRRTGPQLRMEHLHLQGKWPRRVESPRLYHHPAIQTPRRLGPRQLAGFRDLRMPRTRLAGRIRAQSPGVGEHETAAARRGPSPAAGCRHPSAAAADSCATVGHPGGVVIQHDQLEPLRHGTIVP